MAMRLRVLFRGDNTDLKKATKESEGALGNLKRTAMSVARGLAAAYAGYVGVQQLVTVTKEYQRLEAQLRTATGSIEGQNAALAVLQQFASETGQSLPEITTAFTRLVNLGLNPSREALLAYANVAAGTGKTTLDFVEAVADASTAEFERLKEFGIRAKNQGDTIAFTFRGVTTEVEDNATAIEQYLIGLGQNQFGDAINNQAQTLGASLNRAGNAWDEFVYAVSESGVGDVMQGSIDLAADALNELTAMFESGQLAGYLDAYVDNYKYAYQEVIAVVDEAYTWIENNTGGLMEDVGQIFEAIGEFIIKLPIQVRAAVQRMAVELANLVNIGQAYGAAFYEVIKAKLGQVKDYAVAVGRQVGDALQFWEDDQFNFEQAISQADQRAAAATANAMARAEQAANAGLEARDNLLQSIENERQAAMASFYDKIEASNQLREAYDREREAREATDLSQFSKGGSSGPSFDGSGALGAGQNKEFDKLREQLRTEEERINESYMRRRQIILQNTQATSQARQDLLRRLDEQYAQEMLGPENSLDQSIQGEIDKINQEYQIKRQAVMQNTAMTEQQKTALIARLTQQRNNRIRKLEAAQMQMTLGNYQNLFGSLAGVSKTFGGEQSKTYKALFAVSKAFSIAQSIIAIQTGIANAASLPFPGNIAAMATVAAQTASIISTIKGTNMQGQAHDGISRVPASNEGTWMLKRGEMVLNNRQRDNFEYLVDYAKKGGRNAGSPVVHIHNKIDIDARGATEGTEQSVSDALDLATQRMKQELAEDFSNGGPLAQRLRSGGVAA